MSVPLPTDGIDGALVVMAKAPRPGAVKTRLTPAYTPEQAAALSAALLTDTLRLTTTLPGICVAVVCPRGEAPLFQPFLSNGLAVVEQSEQGLAAALASTFEQFLAAGFRKVVAFNSDSPHLARDVLRDAFAELDRADLVVGPTDDGGYYLVGATAAHAGLFDASPLGTSAALDALVGRARALALRVAFCAPGFDIDLPADVDRLAAMLQDAPERAWTTATLLAEWRRTGLRE